MPGPKLKEPKRPTVTQPRKADPFSRRASARHRIERKRLRLGSVEDLLALRNLPEYRITISKESLEEILSSFPEDDE